MSTDISNGKGAIVVVTATAALHLVVPAIGSTGGHLSAVQLRAWNVGDQTIYISVNTTAAKFDADTAIPIPSGERFDYNNSRKPIKKFVVACASGESSQLHWGAF